MKKLLALLVCIGMIFSAGVAAATIITLDFNSLPSDQGWTYVTNNSIPEDNVFSVNNDMLLQNSLGIGLGASIGSTSEYTLFDVVDFSIPFTLSVTAKVTQEEGASSTNSFGFGFAVITQTEWFGFGLGTNRIQGPHMEYLSTVIDNTQFHNYRLDGVPGGSFQFYVDDILIASGSPLPYSGHRGSIALGDFTKYTNAKGELKNFTFTQGEPIPEPASMLLLGSGLIGLFGAQRKWKK